MGKFIYRMILIIAVTGITALSIVYYENHIMEQESYEAATLI